MRLSGRFDRMLDPRPNGMYHHAGCRGQAGGNRAEARPGNAAVGAVVEASLGRNAHQRHAGHNYIDHSYAGYSYIGHNDIGHKLTSTAVHIKYMRTHERVRKRARARMHAHSLAHPPARTHARTPRTRTCHARHSRVHVQEKIQLMEEERDKLVRQNSDLQACV